MDERGAVAGTDVLDGGLERRIAGERIGAVDLGKMKIGKPRTSLLMLPPAVPTSTGTEMAYSLSSMRNRTGSFRLEAEFSDFPELAFAGGAIAAGDVDNFVAVKSHILELAIVAGGLRGCFRVTVEVAAGFGAAHCLQELRPGRR
jgi:hypothetical protein